jgi:hypothetical protein
MGTWEISISVLALRFLEGNRKSVNQLVVAVGMKLTGKRYKAQTWSFLGSQAFGGGGVGLSLHLYTS